MGSRCLTKLHKPRTTWQARLSKVSYLTRAQRQTDRLNEQESERSRDTHTEREREREREIKTDWDWKNREKVGGRDR